MPALDRNAYRSINPLMTYVAVTKEQAQELPDEAFTFTADRGYLTATNAPNMIRERRGIGVVVHPVWMESIINEPICGPVGIDSMTDDPDEVDWQVPLL